MASGDSSLKEVVDTLLLHRPFDTFVGNMPTIQVIVHRTEETTLTLEGLAPFHTIDDVHRAAWLASGMARDVYPKYSYLAVEDPNSGDYIPALGLFKELQDTTFNTVALPDPLKTIGSGERLPEFVDSDGEKKQLSYAPRGRVTLEAAFPQEIPQIFHLFPLSRLLGVFTGTQPISMPDWNGLFYPYFPALDPSATGDFTAEDIKQAEQLKIYIEAKLAQTELLESIRTNIADTELLELRTTGIKVATLQWTERFEMLENEGVDVLFFSRAVNEDRPFMRLLSPNTTPITKLYRPNLVGPPAIKDLTLLKGWVSELSPLEDQQCLLVKVPLRDEKLGATALFGTLQLMDDRTAVFTIQPPREMRVLEPSRDFDQLYTRLDNALGDLLPSMEKVSIGRLSFGVELKFDSMKLSKERRAKLAGRFDSLSTMFQKITLPKEDTSTPILTLRYKAISNFTTEGRVSSYLTWFFSRKGMDPSQTASYAEAVAREFEISIEKALQYIGEYLRETKDVTTIDDDGNEFLLQNNPGIDIAIYSQNVTSYTIQLYNARAITMNDIRRVLTIIEMAFYGSDEAWGADKPSAAAVRKVQIASVVVEEDDRADEDRAEAVAGSVIPDAAGVFFGFNDTDLSPESIEENSKMPPAPTPAAEAVVASETIPAKPVRNNIETEGIVAHEWYIHQLQRLDPELFNVKTGISGKSAKIDKSYFAGKCAANEDRQPVGLTKEQFNKMKDIYLSNPKYANKVSFIVYGEKPAADAKGRLEQFRRYGAPHSTPDDTFTVMRYGSNPASLNYYFCPPLFCLRDLLPILEDDWISEEDIDNEYKPKFSCPFCKGRLIENKKMPGKNEVVVRRKNKPKFPYPHKYINFLKHDHPEGYGIPCCFVADKDIDWMDSHFKAIRDIEEIEKTEESRQKEGDAQQTERLEEALRGREQGIVAYDVIKWKLPKEYILGSEKYPLDPGKIGVPILSLDAYFGQNSKHFVEREAIKQILKPNVNGFFRLGVLNKPLFVNQSLFAAIGPFLGKNTISAVADYMAEMITPRVFLNLNFGNLLLEFFNPADQDYPKGKKAILQLWAKQKRVSGLQDEFELSRLYRSYHRFIRYIRDETQPKQLRHFAHALAEPGLLTTTGVTLVTLHYKDDPRSATSDIEVMCPMLGYDIDRYSRNSVGFLTIGDSGFWEPMVYIGNLSTTQTAAKSAFYNLTHEDILDPSFPPIVRQRIEEFQTTCRSSYRGAFTLHSGVNPNQIQPVQRMIDALSPILKITGLVRDSYNHLVAITVKRNDNPLDEEVLVPVVDDGYSFFDRYQMHMYLTLENIPKAGANEVELIYKTKIIPRISQYTTTYTLESFIQTSTGVIGFTLHGKGGPRISMPCGGIASGASITIPTIPAPTGNELLFEYQLNRQIQMTKEQKVDSLPEQVIHIIDKKQVDSLYEHLRLSFSTWIATSQSSQLRNRLVEILDDHSVLPYEKLRRLYIEFYPTIKSWFLPEQTVAPVEALLRKDCIQITDDQECSGHCKIASDGKCRIHIPIEVPVRFQPEREVQDATKYFTARLFDELIRMPQKRNELMTKGVRRFQVPSTNLQIEDEWIVPDNVPAYYELLRESESASSIEQPQYWEEFSRADVGKETSESLNTLRVMRITDASVPNELRELIVPEGLENLGIRLVSQPEKTPTESIIDFLDLSIYDDAPVASDSFSVQELIKISRQKQIPIIQVLTSKTPISILGRMEGNLQETLFATSAIVLIPDFASGPAVLFSIPDVSISIPLSYLAEPLKESLFPKPEEKLKKKPTLTRRRNIMSAKNRIREAQAEKKYFRRPVATVDAKASTEV
jgi:hypothetical protein